MGNGFPDGEHTILYIPKHIYRTAKVTEQLLKLESQWLYTLIVAFPHNFLSFEYSWGADYCQWHSLLTPGSSLTLLQSRRLLSHLRYMRTYDHKNSDSLIWDMTYQWCLFCFLSMSMFTTVWVRRISDWDFQVWGEYQLHGVGTDRIHRIVAHLMTFSFLPSHNWCSCYQLIQCQESAVNRCLLSRCMAISQVHEAHQCWGWCWNNGRNALILPLSCHPVYINSNDFIIANRGLSFRFFSGFSS